MPHPDIHIREISGFAAIAGVFPLITQLNPDIDEKMFHTRLKNMLNEGYRCIGAFEQERLVGCAGFWVGTRFWCGEFIEPDNVVVERACRGRRIGERLMEWIEEEGRRLKCRIIKLEAYTANVPARSFYGKRDYEEPGVVIVKPLLVDAEEWRAQLQAKAK